MTVLYYDSKDILTEVSAESIEYVHHNNTLRVETSYKKYLEIPLDKFDQAY